MTRSLRAKRSASSAVKSGAEAWITAVSPESSRSSAQAIATMGIAELTSPMIVSGTAARAQLPAEPLAAEAGERDRRDDERADPRAEGQISSGRRSSRTPILMNMNDAPQSAESASRMTR